MWDRQACVNQSACVDRLTCVDQMACVTSWHVWNRVSDPVRRPERPLAFLATPHKTGISPFHIHRYSVSLFTSPARTGFWQTYSTRATKLSFDRRT